MQKDILTNEEAYEIWCDFQSILNDIGIDNSMGNYNYLIIKFMHNNLAPHGLTGVSQYHKSKLRKFLTEIFNEEYS